MPKLETVIKFDLQSWPYLHSSMSPDTFLEFYGPDREDVFSRNLKYMPDDWYYRHKKITYEFNNVGLRMEKDITDLERNFVYFSGTSYSMGIGLSVEDRLSELTAKKLSLDFINSAGPTFTIKTQVLSFFNYLKTNPYPSVLVIEYPPSHAYTFFNNQSAIMYYSKHIPDTQFNKLYDEMKKTTFFIDESNFYRNMLQVLCKQSKIKLIEMSFHPDDKFVEDSNIIVIDPDEIDRNNINERFARDLLIQNGTYSAHPGVGVHKLASEKIIQQLL